MAAPVVPITNDVSLFIDDPKDAKRKHIGKLLVYADGSRVWLRQIGNDHVMRSGRLGMDAMTFDTNFAGKPGFVRVRFGPRQFETTIATFEEHCTEKDYGHGRQYFLAFSHWSVTGPPPEPPKPKAPPVYEVQPPPKVGFGTHQPCRYCKGTGQRRKKPCDFCRGAGFTEVTDA